MTHPVGEKKANPWGIYDMSGNVWEWCSDWYDAYEEGSQTDPFGPEIGSNKVFRGGSWYDFYESHRCANRHRHAVDKGYTAIGFRVVMEVE
jgi:formylglycine-generating enzyme required for sulfatase activity